MHATSYFPWLKICFFLFISIALLHNNSQVTYAQGVLPVDDSTGKITFEEIVKVDSFPWMSLQSNAEAWMDYNFKSDKALTQVNLSEGINTSVGRFPVYTKASLSKTVHGYIRFKVTIYTKPYKYRYVFTDFIFEYYKQNRYYEYVATGKEKPLEDPNFSGWQKPWNRYKVETRNKIIAYIASLKLAMVYKKPAPVEKKVVKKEQW